MSTARASTSAGIRAAVDVGGTFIDLIQYDPATGEIRVEKQPSNPESLADEVLTGLSRFPVPASELALLVHGSTVAVNTIVEERGAKTGIITTRGFRDVLEIGSGSRVEMFNWLYMPAKALVSRKYRLEVDERVDAQGKTVEPLSEQQVLDVADQLVADGVEAVAICFLNSYRNAAHEQEAAHLVSQRHPNLCVTISSEVSGEWNELHRFSSAAMNAYVQPKFANYITHLLRRLRTAGYEHRVPVMQSNGGVIDAMRAAELPIRTVQSGPAGGVIGARVVAEQLGIKNVICADVGGTTYDVAVIRDGVADERSLMVLNGRPVLSASIDIESIGAGGGSIAWLDTAGALRVGPQSAGAKPGPVCFGNGGVRPTVTDAQVVLGWLDPETYLGERMRLDAASARAAIERDIARPLGICVEDAALGILTMAVSSMADAIRRMTIERGVDPRDFAMLSYGGGGGLFAAAVADQAQCSRALVPLNAAVFSAWGLLSADFREDMSRIIAAPLDATNGATYIGAVAELEADCKALLIGLGMIASDVGARTRADMRFAGQEHTVEVDIDPHWTAEDLVRELRARFAKRHKVLYGHADDDGEIELVTLRTTATVQNMSPRRSTAPTGADMAPIRQQEVIFTKDRGFEEVPVYDRANLEPGVPITGPAIVTEWNTTILVPPTWTAVVLEHGELSLDKEWM